MAPAPAPLHVTETCTSLVHTTPSAISQDILDNLHSLIDPATHSHSPPPTFSFSSSILTIDSDINSPAGGAVKRTYFFCLKVTQVSDHELAITTAPSLYDVQNVAAKITLTPETPDTTLVTVTASLSPPVSGRRRGSLSPSPPSTAVRVAPPKTTLRASLRSLSPKSSLRTLSPGSSGSSFRTISDSNTPSHASAILSHILLLLPSLHTRYARYEQVDAAMYKQFELVGVPNAPPIKPHENSLVTRSLLYAHDDSSTSAKFRRIKGTVTEPVSYYEKIEYSERRGGVRGTHTGAWGKAVATIDVPAAQVLSHRWCQNSYEHNQLGKGVLKVILVPHSHSMLFVNVVKFPTPLSNRIFSTWFSWRKEADDSFVIAFAPAEEYAAFDAAAVQRLDEIISQDPLAANAIKGTARGFWVMKPLAKAVCVATYLVQAELGGRIPTSLLNARINSNLGNVEEMQRKFMRNAKQVDKEVRDSFPPPPPLAHLSADQRSIVESCERLENITTTWSSLAYPDKFVNMFITYKPPKKGERSIATGKAEVTVDCPAAQALAWMFAFNSRDRVSTSLEGGNPARITHKTNSTHDVVVATIKVFPFPVTNREFVCRLIAAEVDGKLLYAAASVPDEVDYGMKNKAVRGVTLALMRILPVENSPSQCRVTLFQYADAAGSIPTAIVNSKLSSTLDAVVEMRQEFQRDVEIDDAERADKAQVIRDSPQTYTTEEEATIERVQSTLGALEEGAFDELASPDHLLKMGKIFVEGDRRIICRVSVTVDSSIEECAAWDTLKMSRENLTTSNSRQRSLVSDNEHSAVFRFVKDFNVPGFAPREWVLRMLWRKPTDDTVVVCYESIKGLNYTSASGEKFVQASNMVYNVYKRLDPIGEMPQTHVTWTQRIEMKGYVPLSFVNTSLPKQLMHASMMRKRFDKSLEVDGAKRAQYVAMIAGHEELYSDEEEKVLKEGEKHFADFESMKIKTLKMSSPLTTGEIAYKRGGSEAWGCASTIVHASAEEVLAFCWDTMQRSARRADDVERTEEQVNGHNQVVYIKKRTPKIFADRDFLGRGVWKKAVDGYVLVTSPVESTSRTMTDGVVRGTYRSAMKIKREGDNETVVEYVITPDFGGGVPNFFIAFYLGSNLRFVTELQEKFQEMVEMEDYDAKDGKALGVRLMHSSGEKRKKRWRKVRHIVRNHRGLHQLSIEYDWLVGFLEEVVLSKWVFARSVSTKLECLSEKEARKIGRSLMPALKQRKTALAGLYQWKNQNRSMVELFERYGWVESMMLEVSQEAMNTAPWGLMWRVGTGATLSVVDLITDAVVIVGYMGKEETRGYGYSLLGMLVASMVLQLLIVFLQNRKKPWAMAKEMLVVLTGFKSAWDAWSVCSGRKMEEHHSFDAKAELVATKIAEMVCESIPGCLLQMFVILKIGDSSTRAVTSLAVSALTTGYHSATISYDFDTNPLGRNLNPAFYGYIPDEGGVRSVLLVCMTLNSTLLLLVRAFSAAMLMLVRKKYLAIFIAGDMALYLLQKVARGDFHYWVPVEGSLGLFVSLLARVIVKTVTDFTGVLQFRHPAEIGGLYWTVNMFLALLGSFVSVIVYYESGGGEVEERVAWTLVGSLSGAWVAIFGVLLLLMKNDYRQTFFSTKTGKQTTQDYFKSSDDSVKKEVITENKLSWREIREDVKDWVQENWWRWKTERPEWFTESWIAMVPDDMIPTEDKRPAAGINANNSRRRSGASARIHSEAA